MFYFLRYFWYKLNQMTKIVYFSTEPEGLFVTTHRTLIDVIYWIWKVAERFALYISRTGISWMHGNNRIPQVLQILGIPYFEFAFYFDPFHLDCSRPVLVKTHLKDQPRKSFLSKRYHRKPLNKSRWRSYSNYLANKYILKVILTYSR